MCNVLHGKGPVTVILVHTPLSYYTTPLPSILPAYTLAIKISINTLPICSPLSRRGTRKASSYWLHTVSACLNETDMNMKQKLWTAIY
uniref:Uncharacterized protein n=1 Tax=Pyxicephalus adspersus TaxID=30357 RepID=A0AAV3AM88_PYXAD|nr:TPA: hypothetical protein GDO54_010551 [Pyxicephalus adspersus]